MVERILDKQTGSASLAQGTERAIIVGMEYGAPNSSGWTAEDSLEELKQLADTAGAEVVARFLQKRPKPDPASLSAAARCRSWRFMCSRRT